MTMRTMHDRYKSVLPHYRDTPEKRTLKISVLLIMGAILAMVLIAVLTFLLALRGPEEILVPDVTSRDGEQIGLADAMVELQEKGLLAEIQLKHSSSFTKGTIIDQRPRAGAVVKAGRNVLLTVSEGPVVSSVGRYVGKSLSEVEIELQELFASDPRPLIRIRKPVMYVFDDEPAGTILEQSPPPGAEIQEGEVVSLDLVVSRGPQGKRIEVPDLVEQPFEQAMDEMVRVGVPFTFRIRQAESGEQSGVVAEQDPSAGEEIPIDAVVVLTMTEPRRVEPGRTFGSVQVELPRYPVLVDVELRARRGSQARNVLVMRHPGGPLAIPYVIREDEEPVLYINGREWSP